MNIVYDLDWASFMMKEAKICALSDYIKFIDYLLF